MANISITINPAETIAANIAPSNSISIGPSTSYPPHGLSHAPGAYDSLAAYYASAQDLTGFVDKSSAVLLTGNQNVSGVKNFYSRPTFNGVGVQTTGEYEEFNLWDELSGALYPYPKNDLNRTYNILKRAEINSGPSGETIWYNIPQWTGTKPFATGISSFYNTGFWARDYDWSCVSFKDARTVSGLLSLTITLISPRHALGVKHAQPVLGSKFAFVSNVETGYTWEATVASSYALSGDAMLYTLNEDAPSQIRPASIIGSPPTPSWETHSLFSARALTVKNSTVLFDSVSIISSGGGFQAGALRIGHVPDSEARYTGIHVGGDSSSPVFLPLEDGRLVYLGGASTPASVTFVGDPVIRSGISLATSGYSIDTWNVPKILVSSILPTNIDKIGTETNKWYEINSSYVNALNLEGDLREWNINTYNEYLYGETINATQANFNGITVNTDGAPELNTINFSGTYTDTFWARFVIPNSGASINFSSSGPTLLMPNGSGFSGAGYVIEARAVEYNKILIQPISVPSGYLSGYVNKTETGNFITTSQTGQFVSTGSTGQFVTGSVVRPSQTGAFLTTGAADGRYALQSNTGVFITTGQTGQFYPTSNPSGFLTSGSSIDLIHLYAKNDQGATIYKGQPVYIGGANGANPLIKLASNTGEPTSSKTIGLLAQDLLVNEFGYIITEGILEGFNTSSGNAGDPMWLGTGGNIIYGLANKPYGNNHLVYLGVVLRSNNSNGKVYVKPQNGFEIEELHRVYAKNANTNDTLMYNSGSGSWFARQITTGDVSGISSYAINSSVVSLTGNQNVSGIKNFYSRPTVNGTGVLLSGEASTASAGTSISLISSIWS